MQNAVLSVLLIGVSVCAVSPIRAAGDDVRGYNAIGRFERVESGGSRANIAAAVDPEIQQRFQESLADAAKSDPARISRNLVAITDSTPSLVWKGEGTERKLLTVVWTSWTGYDNYVGSPVSLTRDVWVTLPFELQGYCNSNSIGTNDLSLRLEQLIGLTPNGGRTRFVEMWVSPDDLFRPSPDPEITDHEAQIDFPRETRFSSVSQQHIDWINTLKAVSYGPGGMPWTRLGYTYDWGNASSHVGLSEFVIRSGATVQINSVNSTANYCQSAHIAGPNVSKDAIVNVASGLGGAVAPGELVSIFGSGLGPEAGAASPFLVKGLGGVRVYFDEIEAYLTQASGQQVTASVPFGVSGRPSVNVRLDVGNARSNTVTVPLVSAVPGIFTSGSSKMGQAVAVNQDGGMNSASAPAPKGSVISFWATGQGLVAPAGVDGTGPFGPPYPKPLLPVSVSIGGVTVPEHDVEFVGMVYAVVMQVNVRIPQTAASGEQALLLGIGGAVSQSGVTITVE